MTVHYRSAVFRMDSRFRMLPLWLCQVSGWFDPHNLALCFYSLDEGRLKWIQHLKSRNESNLNMKIVCFWKQASAVLWPWRLAVWRWWEPLRWVRSGGVGPSAFISVLHSGCGFRVTRKNGSVSTLHMMFWAQYLSTCASSVVFFAVFAIVLLNLARVQSSQAPGATLCF